MEPEQENGAAAPPAEQWVPVNVWETEHAIVVVAPMPGVMIEDVVVRLEDGVLELTADLRTPAPKQYRMQEWLYGSYRRTLELGAGFGEPITASLGNGLLAVSIARATGDAGDPVEVQPVAAGSPSSQ
jgi:HSP20 family protein